MRRRPNTNTHIHTHTHNTIPISHNVTFLCVSVTRRFGIVKKKKYFFFPWRIIVRNHEERNGVMVKLKRK